MSAPLKIAVSLVRPVRMVDLSVGAAKFRDSKSTDLILPAAACEAFLSCLGRVSLTRPQRITLLFGGSTGNGDIIQGRWLDRGRSSRSSRLERISRNSSNHQLCYSRSLNLLRVVYHRGGNR